MGSEVWMSIVAKEHGHDKIEILRSEKKRNGHKASFDRGSRNGRGLAYYPFYSDVKLDLSAAQIFPEAGYPEGDVEHCVFHSLEQFRVNNPVFHTFCMKYEEKHVANVALKYFHGGSSDKIVSSKNGKGTRKNDYV